MSYEPAYELLPVSQEFLLGLKSNGSNQQEATEQGFPVAKNSGMSCLHTLVFVCRTAKDCCEYVPF